MGRVTRFPVPDGQTSHDHLATWLGLHVDVGDVAADRVAGEDDFIVVDVRPFEAYVRGHVPRAIHFPPGEMDEATVAHHVPAGKVAVCCGRADATDAQRAAVTLATFGVPAKVLLGGMDAWSARGFPVEGA